MSIILTQRKYRRKNYEKAKDNLLKCLDLKDSFEILNLLGVVYIHLKEYDNSIQVLKKFIKKSIKSLYSQQPWNQL